MRLPKVLFTGTPARALTIPGVGAAAAATGGIGDAYDMGIDHAKSSAFQPPAQFLARLVQR